MRVTNGQAHGVKYIYRCVHDGWAHDAEYIHTCVSNGKARVYMYVPLINGPMR